MNSFEILHSENVRAEAKDAILVIPVGAVEQHGPHLPLTVDTEIPVRIASMLVKRLKVIVAPAVTYGARSLPQGGGGPGFPGTINIRGSVLTDYLRDIIAGYIATGFRSIVILNGHYENESFIFEALEICREEGKLEGVKVIAMGWWSVVSDAVLEKLFGDRFPGWHAQHASVCETSLMLHFRNDLVAPTQVDNTTPPNPGISPSPADSSKISDQGVPRSSSPATPEIGLALCEEICSQLVALVQQHMGAAPTSKRGASRNRSSKSHSA
jgi:creatinine amidohydrolase